MPKRIKVLVMAGTGEGREVAKLIADDGRFEGIASIAKATKWPRKLSLTTRRGGFGGPEKLRGFIVDEGFDLVIDATHPFSVAMSKSTRWACTKAACPLLRVHRPAWQPLHDDRWIRVPNFIAAAQMVALRPGKVVFLSIGRQWLWRFSEVKNRHFLVRMVDKPKAALPLDDYKVILGKGPFKEIDEVSLLLSEQVDLLVTRNSGGNATYAKIIAARRLGLPVIIVDQPEPLKNVETVTSIEKTKAWLDTFAEKFSGKEI